MISDDNVFEENKGLLSATGAVNSNRSLKKLSLYQKALSSNNILVEDGRMSRSKRKLNLKTLFTSSDDDTNTNLQRRQLQHQRRFSDRQKSIGHSKNTPDSSNIKISNVQTSLEYLNNLEESLNDLDMISRTCKQNFKQQQTTVIPHCQAKYAATYVWEKKQQIVYEFIWWYAYVVSLVYNECCRQKWR